MWMSDVFMCVHGYVYMHLHVSMCIYLYMQAHE
uniref:Uncharacterized protein n=1 Tax=Anguilla anguilla TaxID=7936 RepID=A0A0E9UZG2_ANGAN